MPITRDRLRELVDDLPDEQLEDAELALRALNDPVLRAFLNAPEDDEPTTAEDLAAIAEGHEAAARGETVPLADVVAEFRRRDRPGDDYR